MARPRVYVADQMLPSTVDSLHEYFALVNDLASAPDGVLSTFNTRVDSVFLDAAGPQLQIIANYGVGVNNIDLAAAAARGVVVTNTPDVLTAAVAEYAVGLMLALLRRIAEGDRMIRTARPWGDALDFMLGESLDGKTLAIVGPGRIGLATAERAKAFGVKPVFVERGSSPAEALVEADIVSIHTPLTDQTFHLVDARWLAAMRPTAVLVNTSRGPVVDESALVDALERGQIAGAALDVFEREPEVAERLLRLDNVVLTPHLGSATLDTREAMGALAVRSLKELLIDDKMPSTSIAPQ